MRRSGRHKGEETPRHHWQNEKGNPVNWKSLTVCVLCYLLVEAVNFAFVCWMIRLTEFQAGKILLAVVAWVMFIWRLRRRLWPERSQTDGA